MGRFDSRVDPALLHHDLILDAAVDIFDPVPAAAGY
jgi:hypothetical protein